MNVIDDVRREREDLARVLQKHSGIRKIVEDLYPDNAHFIYELLQNAEDRGATQVSFTLSNDSLGFEHNGETFRPRDIYAITDIGEGTKSNDEDQIGRFGVGFKAVFAYSETPHIWSPTFSFKISELVLPSTLVPRADVGGNTRFEFPFNNPKKAQADAYDEIQSGLDGLAETTLLFLRSIESIKWETCGAGSGEIRRIQRGKTHVEILKNIDDSSSGGLHFLKFEKPIDKLSKHTVAVAFPLDFLPGNAGFSSRKRLSKQLKIVPAFPGQVAIFFPAAKESSGLRFHVHGPFVPELSRSSIKETNANLPLFEKISTLTAESLHEIRDLGLLTTDFLGVLPNPQDQLGSSYECIRNVVLEALDNEPLTPTLDKSHAPARLLFQAKASLKNLLSHDDIEFLISYEGEPPRWAANRALQGTNVERMMNGLSITDWDIDEFVRKIVSDCARRYGSPADPEFMNWLKSKPLEWHQQLYALLHRESETYHERYRLKEARIVRLSDGDYAPGRSCHFPGESVRTIAGIPTVDHALYTSGNSRTQQEDAKQFLIWSGVSAIGEKQLVQAILTEDFNDPNTLTTKEYFSHLDRFIKLHADDPACAAMFTRYRLFIGEDGEWHFPRKIFLDNPYVASGLKAYYQAIREDDGIVALSEMFRDSAIDTQALVRFAEAVGARTFVELRETSCRGNSEWKWLSSVPGKMFSNPLDQDYVFPGFSDLIAKPTVTLSRLIWLTMCAEQASSRSQSGKTLKAHYRRNLRGGTHSADSQLVHQLREAAWIPQGSHFVRPGDATAESLPEGFPFDSGAAWIQAIGFGKNISLQAAHAQAELARAEAELAKKEAAAQELGFRDADTADRLRRLDGVPPHLVEKLLDDWNRRQATELPDSEPLNPQRRSVGVLAEAMEAPERHNEPRIRAVVMGQGQVKEEAEQYLKQQYTNTDAELVCQICKTAMPFRLDSGEHYFEKVQLLPDLTRLHRQNYLALCPNHSAMFQYCNGSGGVIRQRLVDLQENELPIVLAREDASIYFTRTHISDIQAMLRAEQNLDAAAGRTQDT